MSEPIEQVVQRLTKDLAYMASGRVVSFSGDGKLRMQADLDRLIQEFNNRKSPLPDQLLPPEKPVPTKERPRNPLMDRLALIEGHNLKDVTANAWKRIGVALKEIKSAAPQVTVEEITRRASNYRKKYPTRDLTANALASWWGTCGDTAKPGAAVDTRVPDNMRAR